MTRDQLEAQYRRYIDCLNERRLDDAETFYADELVYNGKRTSRAEWRRTAIEDSFVAMPDLQWSIQHLVIDGVDIAARLLDSGVLKTPFRGVEPTGLPVYFAENVFYRFNSSGRINEVWSIVDFKAMRPKLTS